MYAKMTANWISKSRYENMKYNSVRLSFVFSQFTSVRPTKTAGSLLTIGTSNDVVCSKNISEGLMWQAYVTAEIGKNL